MSDLIEPNDEAPESEFLREDLLSKGLPPHIADAVTAWFFSEPRTLWWPNSFPEPGTHRMESLVYRAGEAFKGDTSDNIALLKFLDLLVAGGVLRDAKGRRIRAPGVAVERRAECAAIMDDLLPRFLAIGLDLPSAMRQAADAGVPFQCRYEMEASVAGSRFLRPATSLDMAPLRNWDRWSPHPGPGNNDPGSVMYWLYEHGIRGLAGLEEVVFAEPDETVGRVAGAILAHIEFGMVEPRFPAPVRCRDGTPVHPAAVRISSWTDHLVDRASRREGDVHLLSATFESTEIVYRLTQQRVPERTAAKVARVAGRALGLLRRNAREMGSECNLVNSQTGRSAHGLALVALATTEGLGSALVNGTQVLRALQEPAVGPDLRPSPDPPLPPPPERWSWLPSAMLGLIHNIGRYEERTDPHLIEARMDFAEFLLDRLKPEKGTSAGPREPDAIWRRCCIRALRELSVNPEGRVHRGLHKVIEGDPDPQVKVTAKSAYDVLRRADGDTGEVSPRRRLMAATWWLRQAHRLALGLDVDEAGARRTRNREASQTDVDSTGTKRPPLHKASRGRARKETSN